MRGKDTPAESPAGEPSSDGPTARQNLVFFVLTLGVFLATRLIGLERFPIYFFCDEAVQTVQATRLLANGFRDEYGNLLPTYFRDGESFNLSIGVYLQVLPQKVFGHSVFVARSTQVLVLLTAMAAVGLMLRDFFRLRFWWVGVLVLSAMPGWFLHTRIAFELMLATSCYVWFLYFYLRYRGGRPRAIFPALLFGSLTFYGYNTFQPVIVATGLLLLVVDARYHWSNRKTVLWAVPFLAALVLPYLRYLHDHPGEIGDRLRWLFSYWSDPKLTLPEKLRAYGSRYIRSFLSPYWFRPESGDLPRHLMKGRAHLSPFVLPLAVVGALLCALRIRRPAERTLLVALAAAPVGAVIVALGITRAMTFVIVVAMLAAITADALLRAASRLAPPVVLATAVFAGLAASQGYLLADALRHGPTWFTDYGLYGMQWGANEVFGEVRQYARRYPQAAILVSPNWTNGADDIQQFFLPGTSGVRVCCTIDALRFTKMKIPDQTLLVMMEPEYQSLVGDRRFADVRLDKTLNYPDGSPGFRFVWLRYAPDFDAQQAAVRDSWHVLRQEDVLLDGEVVCVGHSALELSGIASLFDGNPATLVRTEYANPAVIVVDFPRPRQLRGIRLTTASMDFEVRVSTTGAAGTKQWSGVYRNLEWDPTIELPWPEESVDRIRVEVLRLDASEPDHVHLRDLAFF